MHAVNEVDSDIESISVVHVVDSGGHQIYGEIKFKDFPVWIQIDSGATQCNPEEVYRRQSRNAYLHRPTNVEQNTGYTSR